MHIIVVTDITCPISETGTGVTKRVAGREGEAAPVPAGRSQEIDVSIVIVSYNVAGLLLACIASIREQTTASCEIIVCDNNSTDNSVELVRESHPDVHLIVNRENVGFARANNQAIACSGGRYILLLNPDTVVTDGAIDKLVRFMDLHPDAGACGPKLLNPDMTLQPNCHHFPSLLIRISKYAGLNKRYPRSRLFGREFMTYWNYDEVREIEWLTGCALCLRTEALRTVGLLDENYFMYSEETDLCFRMRRAGYRLLFCPEAAVMHYHGQSARNCTDGIVLSGTILRHLYRSEYYFFKKNYGTVFAVFVKVLDLAYFSLRYARNWFTVHSPVRSESLSALSFMISLVARSLFARHG